MQPVAFFIYFIGGLAETNRAPFDLPEAEQELVGRVPHRVPRHAVRVLLPRRIREHDRRLVRWRRRCSWAGGWRRSRTCRWLSFLGLVPGWAWFILKTFVFLYVFLWVRATLPRYRYDQLMRLGWKWLIPLAILNVVVTGLREGAGVRGRRPSAEKPWSKQLPSTSSRR